jgi:CHASE2 domain-containing sensor protein
VFTLHQAFAIIGVYYFEGLMDFRTIREHSIRYWLYSLAAIVGGMLLSYYFHEKQIWLTGRYRVYKAYDWASPNPREPKHAVLVLIEDEEYWKGKLARRVPTRRDYLADVVKALERCEPSVIALDFNLTAPTLDGSLIENPEYARETALLVDAVLQVSKRRPVVLPAMIGHARPEEPFSVFPSVYGDLPFAKGKLQRGYINLPFDIRQIPTPQPLVTGSKIDSFAVSIVRARHENMLKATEQSNVLPFGTFIEKPFPTISTKDVLEGKCGHIPSKIAIIGAGWNQLAFGAGGSVDLHPTPLGMISGALIHANYVEALIDGNTRKPLPHAAGQVIEFFVLVVFAVFVAIKTNRSYNKILIVSLGCFALVLISYVTWQNVGYYFDFVFPAIFLLLHAFLDYFVEIQKEARAFRKLAHQ